MCITSETLVYLLNKTQWTKSKVAFSEFVVLAVNCAITVNNSYSFLHSFYVKTNSNLMCGSF